MNRTIKTFVAIAIISSASAGLFASPKVSNKTLKKLDVSVEKSESAKKEMVKLSDKDKKDEKEERSKDFLKKNVKTLTGKVNVTKKGFVTFDTKEGTYILTVAAFEGQKNQISMRDIKVKNGSKLVLSGFVNEESKVFTVIKNGFMKESHPDAK